MPAPYSLDLRERIVQAYRNKEGTMREIAERFEVDTNTVFNLVRLARQTGQLAPRPHGGGARAKVDEAMRRTLADAVALSNDLTEKELAAELEHQHGVVVSRATVGVALRRMGLTRKKNTSRHRTRPPGRPA